MVDATIAARRALLRRLLSSITDVDALDGLLAPSVERADVAGALAPIAASHDATISWVGVNGSRVDATIESTDGGTWRVVFGSADGERVDWLAVYTRRAYVPEPGGLAVVLNGPSGAGKSKLMDVLSRRTHAPWVRFDEPMYGAVGPEYLIWRDAADVLHRGFLAGMAALAGAGNRVITSAAGLPQAWFQEAFRSVPTMYVGLDCPLDVLLARGQGRDGRWGGLAESSIGAHDGWDYDLRLDSAQHSPDVLADQLLRSLAERGMATG